MSLSTPQTEQVQVIVVQAEACHSCVEAHKVLAALAASYPLVIHTLDAGSAAGRALMARHRAPLSPLVLLDGEFFSSGRLPRRKLEKVLTGRFGDAGTAARSPAKEVHHG